MLEMIGRWRSCKVRSTFWLRNSQKIHNATGWWLWFIALRESDALIGGAGFKGRPTLDGRVDIGFAISDRYQRQGYATEAVRGLLAWAWSDHRVKYIVGETLDALMASQHLMEKLGFRYTGKNTDHEGEGVEVLRYELRQTDC